MEGFSDNVPFTCAVTWLKNPDGTPTEVPLANAKPFPYGLLAETNNGGQITRWFVPWSALYYVKQVQPIAPASVAPTPPPAPVKPVGDPHP